MGLSDWLWVHNELRSLQYSRVKDTLEKVKYPEVRRILSAIKQRGMEIYIVSGKQGVGKSAYTLKVLDALFSLVIDDPKERARAVVEHVFFDPADAYKQIIHYHLMSDNRQVPIMVFDDAGVWFSKKMWFVDRKRYLMIYGLWQYARSHLNTIILTCPAVKLIPSELRASGYTWLNVVYHRSKSMSPWTRIVKAYNVVFVFDKWYYNPLYETNVYDIRVRDEIWRLYWPFRQSFVSKWEKVLFEEIPKQLGVEPIRLEPST